jgi:hypothetical protein
VKTTVDVGYFIKRWYKTPIQKFLADHGLIGITKDSQDIPIDLISYNNLANGILFAVTKNLHFAKLEKPTIVIGGPCISDCVRSLTFESAIDVFNVISIAKLMKIRGIVWIGVYEEIVKSGSNEWEDVGRVFETFVDNCSKLLNYHNVKAVRTDLPEVRECSDKHIAKIEERISKKELLSLYDFSKKSNNPGIDAKDEAYYSACKSTLSTYLPSLIDNLSDHNKPKVLVAENSHQSKAVNLAIQINDIMFNDFTGLGPFQFVHLPVPDSSGGNRMYRSTEDQKIYLTENRSELKKKLMGCKPRVLDYWFRVMPPEIMTSTNLDGFLESIETLAGLC